MFNTSSDGEGSGSFLSETFQLEGNISCKGSLRVAGIIDGNIVSCELTILDTGSVKGDIQTVKIEIEGQVNGNIEANNVYLGRNAVIRGDIHFFETLKTEEGVDVDGYIKKIKKSVTREQTSDQENQKKFSKPTLVKDINKAV